MYNTSTLPDRLEKVYIQAGGISMSQEEKTAVSDEAIAYATEVVSAAMLEKCCCKNEEVECYFCKLTHEVLKKLEEV